MSILDYRSVEVIRCAGLPITTFLSDDRSVIMISVTDVVDQLNLDVDNLEDYEGLHDYILYDINGRQNVHYCMPYIGINDFLWMHTCRSSTYSENLNDFRIYLIHEVLSFWDRFESSAASLSIRDALKVITNKSRDYQEVLGLPASRVYEMATSSLGYRKVPNRENLTTEELSFVTLSELLYASVVASEQTDGHSVGEAMRIADTRLDEPLGALGIITRGCDNL